MRQNLEQAGSSAVFKDRYYRQYGMRGGRFSVMDEDGNLVEGWDFGKGPYIAA